MKWVIGVLCLILVLASGLPTPTDAQGGELSDAPYIYYYSDILDAFVIERADGTDSRVIGEGLTRAYTNSIAGPGWSPSGEWLAWTAEEYIVYALSYGVPFITNRSGETFQGLESYINAEMAWAPNDDVLMVAGITGEIDESVEEWVNVQMTMRFEMIDVNTNRMIVADERPYTIETGLHGGARLFNYPANISVAWSTDGEEAVVRYFANETTSEEHSLVFNRDGSMREVVHDTGMAEQSLIDGARGGIHAGKIAYYWEQNEGITVIEDFFTGERYDIDIDGGNVTRIILNPVQNSALLLVDCFTVCASDTWLWEAENNSVQMIMENLPRSQPEWSPDGMYVLFTAHESMPELFRLESHSVDRLELDSPPRRFVWVDGGIARFMHYEDGFLAREVDLSTRETIRTFPTHFGFGDPDSYAGAQWSPDGHLLAFIDEGLVLLDTNYDVVRRFRPSGRSWNAVYGGEAYWHPEGEWLFVAEDALVAGGGEPRHIGIAKTDGTVRRDLDTCQDAGCYGWLPANVDIGELPEGQASPMIREPERILHGTDWSLYVSWSPDGNRLFWGPSTYIDVETGEVIGQIEDEVWEIGDVEWMLDERGQYVPHYVEPSRDMWGENRYVLAWLHEGEQVVVTEEGSVNVYDVDTETLVFSGHLLYPDHDIVVSPDSRWLVVGGGYWRVGIYDTATWELAAVLNTSAMAVAFSPDGRTLAVASSWDIQLWDVETLLENGEE